MLVLVESLGRENVQGFSEFYYYSSNISAEKYYNNSYIVFDNNHYVPILKFPPFTVVHSCGNLLKKLNALGFIHIG